MKNIQVAPDGDPPTKWLTPCFKHPANSVVTRSQTSFHFVVSQLVVLHRGHGSEKKNLYLELLSIKDRAHLRLDCLLDPCQPKF